MNRSIVLAILFCCRDAALSQRSVDNDWLVIEKGQTAQSYP